MRGRENWFCLDCRIPMAWHETGFWKCPECGTETWPPEPEEVNRLKRWKESHEAALRHSADSVLMKRS